MTAPSADAMFRSAFGHDAGRYAAAAMAREAEAVAMAAQGGRNAALNKAAHALGGLIAAGHLDRAHVEQRLTEAALAVGLDVIEARGTIASGLRAGLRKPRNVPDRPGAGRAAHPPKSRRAPPLPPPPRPPELFAELQPKWAALWDRETQPITASTPCGRYLLDRGCVLPPRDGHLREHPSLPHPSGYVGPALMGLVTDVRDASHRMNLHLTWIAGDGSGRKAAVDRPRRLLWRHPKKGGCIRLWRDDAVTLGLGVAEGIETACSLAKSYTPVWSAIDAGNLAALPYLYPLEHLTVACDHDPAGMRAAAEITRRWTAAAAERLDDPADFSSWIFLPRKPDTDANDAPRFDFPGAPNPAWEAAAQDECLRLGRSPYGSAARVTEIL